MSDVPEFRARSQRPATRPGGAGPGGRSPGGAGSSAPGEPPVPHPTADPEPPGLFLDAALERELEARIRRGFRIEARFLRGVEARGTARGRFPFCVPRAELGCTRTDCLAGRIPTASRWNVYRCHQNLAMALLPFEMPPGEDLALHCGPFLVPGLEVGEASLAPGARDGLPRFADPEAGELAVIEELVMGRLEARRLEARLARREASLAAAVGTQAVVDSPETLGVALERGVQLANDVAGGIGAALVEIEGVRFVTRARVGVPGYSETDLRAEGRGYGFPVVLESRSSVVLPATGSLPTRLLVPVGGADPGAVLAVAARPGGGFGEVERRLVEGVALQLERSLEAARREHDRRHRISNLEVLHRIEEQIHGTLDLVDVVETTLGVLDSSFRGRAMSCLVLGDGSSDLHVRDQDGSFRVVNGFRADGDPGGWAKVLESTQPRTLDPDPSRGDRIGYFPEGSVEALGCLLGPVHKPVGALVLALDHPTTDEDRQMLRLIALPVAQALKNAILFEKGERQIAELSLINEMGKALTSSLDLDDVLTYVVDMIASILEADRGSLMLLDPDTNELYVEVGMGIGDPGRTRRLALGEGIAGYVAASQQAALSRDTSTDARYLHYGERRGPALTLVSSPITCKQKILGVLNFERPLESARPFTGEDLELLTTLASQAGIAIENARLYKDLISVYFDTIRSLASALEAKDTYTHGHSRRVAKDAVRVARRLGLPRKALEVIRHGALLHDIGKIGIRESILFKPGPLDAEERQHIQSHPVLGANIISSIDLLKDVKDIVRHHHERWDGCGFPDRLRGEEIPLGARIVCITDSFDAMITSRPYREGMPISQALGVLREERGKQFDPRLVDVFVEVIHSMHPSLKLAERASASASPAGAGAEPAEVAEG